METGLCKDVVEKGLSQNVVETGLCKEVLETALCNNVVETGLFKYVVETSWFGLKYLFWSSLNSLEMFPQTQTAVALLAALLLLIMRPLPDVKRHKKKNDIM